MTRTLNHQKMMKLEHIMKFSHEICATEYLQGTVLPDEWPLEMATKLVSFPLAHLHLPGLLRPPGRTRVGCPRLLQSMLNQLFTVFTASCLRQVPMRTGTRKTTLRFYKRGCHAESWLQARWKIWEDDGDGKGLGVATAEAATSPELQDKGRSGPGPQGQRHLGELASPSNGPWIHERDTGQHPRPIKLESLQLDQASVVFKTP